MLSNDEARKYVKYSANARTQKEDKMCKVSRKMRFQKSSVTATTTILPDDKIKSIDFFNCNFKGMFIPEKKCERNI